MSTYRDILYRDYSASFAGQKTLDAGVQHAQYEATYDHLPTNRNVGIVDLGCGKGEWLSWMASKGYSKLTGVDLSPSDLAIARQNNPDRIWEEQNVITYLESQSGSFDLLHAKDIIEHFTKDEFIQFLLAAKKALKPGGELWLLTFNAQSPLSSAIRYGDFTHEIGLTPASMAQCLRACGFSHISVQGRHYCSTSASGQTRRILGEIVFGLARLLLKIRHGDAPKERGIDLHCTQPDLFTMACKV
ncbi:class I SAM-dependent methyltransferase [Prosthecobacter sp.]|uniref:class I SAM-dependent methyltransferase n=1 Tax=Prosthecobacter sp. TaxID=1965333 RepID=UPI001DEADD27|nr:class I SAM-dependent methyltransferase [Prosthecobacter sp.]MCB1278114.1 class I SAM-dependent methyltransferase [Prosthecobacter sp.]